jgi:hypothetical protein
LYKILSARGRLAGSDLKQPPPITFGVEDAAHLITTSAVAVETPMLALDLVMFGAPEPKTIAVTEKSGWQDLNLQQPAPKAGPLPG